MDCQQSHSAAKCIRALNCPTQVQLQALTLHLPLVQIINNILNGNGDDLIAIQGTYLLVVDFDASQKAVTVAIGNPLGCAPL